MITSKNTTENYCTEISNESTTIFADVTAEKGGKGKHFRPHDLLCASFSSCLNISARMMLDNKKIKYENVIVKVDIDRSHESKTKFLFDINIIGDITEDIKKEVISSIINCPVRKTLSKDIEFITP